MIPVARNVYRYCLTSSLRCANLDPEVLRGSTGFGSAREKCYLFEFDINLFHDSRLPL